MVTCKACGKEMPAERLECGYTRCAGCQNEFPYQGFQVFGHKTGGEPVLIKGNPQNAENLRQAERANRRAR